jgi:hypothetical protein|tara:strand:+ start:398 stop:553 length:156 start_codon:yes stop_codon:yes gene_type:complete
MPFKSEKQRRYLWAKEPAIAKRWTEKYSGKPTKKGGLINKKKGGTANAKGR